LLPGTKISLPEHGNEAVNSTPKGCCTAWWFHRHDHLFVSISIECLPFCRCWSRETSGQSTSVLCCGV
jgi:hypothetical protein